MNGLRQLASNLAASQKDWPRREQILRGNVDAIRDTIKILPLSTVKYFYADAGMLALEEFEQAVEWVLPLDRATYRP